MTSWVEIKNLATQLKNIQKSEINHLISDRTVVNIISHLTSIGRLHLIRTLDGRCLLTLDQLDNEIIQELDAHGGHCSVCEIATNLDVDISIAESRVSNIVKLTANSKTDACIIVGGYLITKKFLRKTAEEIRDKFELRGVLTSIELTRLYNFPSNFIAGLITDFNGILFNVHKDDEKYYTESYLNKQKAKVLGYFSAILTPTSISSASTKLELHQRLLTSIIDGLISGSQLKGSLTIGRSVYTPFCYSNAQDSFISAFYLQNGYVESNFVKRLGISDATSYFRIHFPNAIYTKEFCVSENILFQLKSVIADGLDETPWIEITQYLPPYFGNKEREWLIMPILKETNLIPLCDFSFLYCKDHLNSLTSCFDEYIREIALKSAEERKKVNTTKSCNNQSIPDDMDIRQGNKKVKSGGFGVRSREIKSKNVKKKYFKKMDHLDTNSSDVDDSEILPENYLSREKLLSILSSKINSNAPEALQNGLLDILLPDLNSKFTSLSKSIFLQTSETSKNRDRFSNEKDSLIASLLSIQLLERGALALDDVNLKQQIICHLIRNYVSTFVNRLYMFLAQIYEVQWPVESTYAKQTNHKHNRNKKKNETLGSDETPDINANKIIDNPIPSVISDPANITAQMRDALFKTLSNITGSGPTLEAANSVKKINLLLRPTNELFDNLNSQLPLDEIFNLCDNLASSHLGINLSVSILRNPRTDTKRKRQDRVLAIELASQVERQIAKSTEDFSNNPDISSIASIALAASSLFVQALIGWPIPVNGKFVPQLATWIQEKLAVKLSKSKPGNSNLVINGLQADKAGEYLLQLKDIVTEQAKGDVPLDSKRVQYIVDHISTTASKCLKNMEQANN